MKFSDSFVSATVYTLYLLTNPNSASSMHKRNVNALICGGFLLKLNFRIHAYRFAKKRPFSHQNAEMHCGLDDVRERVLLWTELHGTLEGVFDPMGAEERNSCNRLMFTRRDTLVRYNYRQISRKVQFHTNSSTG